MVYLYVPESELWSKRSCTNVFTTFGLNDGNRPNNWALLIHTAVSADSVDKKTGTCCGVKLLAPNLISINDVKVAKEDGNVPAYK